MKAYEWVLIKFNELQKRKFYGKLIIELREGKVVLMRLDETKVPPENLE